MTQQPEERILSPSTTKAFVAATGTDATTAHKFLSARNYDLESAIILFTQNYQFLSEVNAFYKDHPPFPFAILERNLFSFTPAMSNDTAGVPVLIVNLEHWDPTWTFKDLEALRGLQWVVHWILNKALQM
ncbi:hypothetical protein HDU79_009337 [Rhizoclosmatium sp. JEL0117]|nr:hypothetical protein HDU79_009337 [Rhizoclosmatium sp. JEL0117]